MPGDRTESRPADDAGRPIDGRSTRWDAHRARRREQVVDAALTVLGTHGPDFGLDQVAAEAGVTKPVIYRHFGDRATLLDAMADRATNRLMERLMPVLYEETALPARIRATVDVVLCFFDESPNIFLLYRLRMPGEAGDVAGAGKQFVSSALESLLTADLEALGFHRPELARVWAQGLVGFVLNTTEWWLGDRGMTREAVAEELSMLIWAQIEGLARMHGVRIDPDAPLRPGPNGP